jgi:hypothetical protein
MVCHAAHYWGVDRSMHCICMAYGCELQVGTMFVVLCIPLYYYQPGEFLCSGTDAPMCSLLHLLHVPCSAMYKCFGVWLCLPVQCYGPLFSWSIQLPLGFVCSAHVGGHNPGTLGGVGLVVSWYTRVTKSSSSSLQIRWAKRCKPIRTSVCLSHISSMWSNNGLFGSAGAPYFWTSKLRSNRWLNCCRQSPWSGGKQYCTARHNSSCRLLLLRRYGICCGPG